MHEKSTCASEHSLLESQENISRFRWPRFKRKSPVLFSIVTLCLVSIWFLFINSPSSPSEVPHQNPWFTSLEVQQFKKSYPPKHYSLATPSITYMLQECQSGFGSFVNNFLNVFLIALDNNIAFHLQSLEWCYVSWLTFFEDYSSQSQSPIVLDRFNKTLKRWRSTEGSFNDISSGKFRGHVFMTHGGENFPTYRNDLMRKITGPVFQRKQVVAQVLWDPKPFIKKVVLDIRKNYVDNGEKIFISMHIRRGDKLNFEMKEIPTSSYVERLLGICNSKYRGKNIALFVFSDDDSAVTELRSLLAKYLNIEVFVLTDAFKHIPDLSTAWKPLIRHQGYNQDVYRDSDADTQLRLTAEIITDITLAATSDEFICSFTSNIGRLVALLRTTPLSTVHSLDLPEWDFD